jgi:hypothetical protein
MSFTQAIGLPIDDAGAYSGDKPNQQGIAAFLNGP